MSRSTLGGKRVVSEHVGGGFNTCKYPNPPPTCSLTHLLRGAPYLVWGVGWLNYHLMRPTMERKVGLDLDHELELTPGMARRD
jgi:hypothetical protein